jgi:hypothetical protein
MAQRRSGLRCARRKIVDAVAAGLVLLGGARLPAGAQAEPPANNPAKLGVGNGEADRRWKSARATVFWVGEAETEDNDHIANFKSAWDANWVAHFGGIDNPEDRCGFEPCGFKPKENAFYVALPYDDMEENGRRKAVNGFIPWNRPGAKQSLLKNRWVAVRANGITCYAQWQDVGPFEKDDHAYVFGVAARPKNSKGESAGIDLSPAVRDCLGVGGLAEVKWRHVEGHEVPRGPWKRTVTKRPGP